MGTRFKIILYARNKELAVRAANAAFERVAELDGIMSDYRETSELMRLCHRAGGGPVSVSADLFRVLERAQAVARQSGGAFDVTAGPLVRLWRRARRTGEMPDPQRLAQARALTGYAKLTLDPKTRSVSLERPGMLLDLGGIAKGYAADAALLVLKRFGIRRALVAAGGDIVAGDPPPGARGWAIGIQPLEPAESSSAPRLVLVNAAVSTSGDAEQFVEINGVRYSHILDPRTGLGVTGHSSVTVVAPDGTTSDAMATAASVLGPKDGLAFINAAENVAALFLQSDHGQVRAFYSKHWRDVPQSGPER
jgi:thiamine biosynthesis lipoprotein